MQAVQSIALNKAIKEKDVKTARNNLAVGQFDVDFLARIKGSLNVNHDEPYIPTIHIPLKATLALFIRYCGVTRDAAEAALIRAMTEALNHDQKGEDTILAEMEEQVIEACMERVTALTSALPPQTRKGKVLSNLTVEIVE